jgi:hypothetical protein
VVREMAAVLVRGLQGNLWPLVDAAQDLPDELRARRDGGGPGCLDLRRPATGYGGDGGGITAHVLFFIP